MQIIPFFVFTVNILAAKFHHNTAACCFVLHNYHSIHSVEHFQNSIIFKLIF